VSTNDDERQARIEQIRARLEAAITEHPLPWVADDDEIRSGCATEDERNVLSCCNIEEDALKMIANAPADTAWLLAELDAATARAERAEAECARMVPFAAQVGYTRAALAEQGEG